MHRFSSLGRAFQRQTSEAGPPRANSQRCPMQSTGTLCDEDYGDGGRGGFVEENDDYSCDRDRAAVAVAVIIEIVLHLVCLRAAPREPRS